MVKQISFAAAIVFAALLSFYFLKIGIAQNPYFLIPGILILPLVWGMAVFLMDSALIVFVTSLFLAGIFLIFFGFNLAYLICATLLILSLTWGFKKVNQEKQLRIKILVEEIVPKGVGWLLAVLAVIIAVGFYFSPRGQGFKEGIKIPAVYSAKILSLAVPGFSLDLTTDEMINLLARREKNAPISKEAREQVLKQLDLGDLNLTGQEKISQRTEILDQLVSGKVNQIIKGLAEYIPILMAIFVWQILMWANKILIPLIILLDLLIYLLLRSVGFVKIEKIQTEKEVLKL